MFGDWNLTEPSVGSFENEQLQTKKEINRGPEKEMEEKTTSFIYIDEKALEANAAHSACLCNM